MQYTDRALERNSRNADSDPGLHEKYAGQFAVKLANFKRVWERARERRPKDMHVPDSYTQSHWTALRGPDRRLDVPTKECISAWAARIPLSRFLLATSSLCLLPRWSCGRAAAGTNTRSGSATNDHRTLISTIQIYLIQIFPFLSPRYKFVISFSNFTTYVFKIYSII